MLRLNGSLFAINSSGWYSMAYGLDGNGLILSLLVLSEERRYCASD